MLKGVTIGENTVVGAGSVVSRSLPANVIAVGNPARVIKPLPDGEGTTRADLFNMDIHYAQFADEFMRERLKGIAFCRGWGVFCFHGVLTNVPIETPSGRGAKHFLKPGYDGSCPLSPNSKVTIKQRNTTALPTIRRFSLNLLEGLTSPDSIFWAMVLAATIAPSFVALAASRSHQGPKMNPVGNAWSEPVMPTMALAFTAAMKSGSVDLRKDCQSVRNRLIAFISTHPN